jgi:hypothetical protein
LSVAGAHGGRRMAWTEVRQRVLHLSGEVNAVTLVE